MRWIVAALTGAAILAFALFVHPFLAITLPVRAEILVVEGWVPNYVLDAAAREFKQGGYSRLYISGLDFEKNDHRFSEGSDAARAAKRLMAGGIEASALEPSPVAATGWNRTSSMARGVREHVRTHGAMPAAINVITLGPHARQTLLAYRRAMGPGIAVGVISIPKDDYNPDRWWASGPGIKKTIKDFAGWLREFLFGPRS